MHFFFSLLLKYLLGLSISHPFLISVSRICNLHVVLSILLTTTHSISFQLMLCKFFLLSFTSFWRISCSFLSVSFNKTVSVSRRMFLRFWLPILNPDRSFSPNLYRFVFVFKELIFYAHEDDFLSLYFLKYFNTLPKYAKLTLQFK